MLLEVTKKFLIDKEHKSGLACTDQTREIYCRHSDFHDVRKTAVLDFRTSKSLYSKKTNLDSVFT